MESSSSTWNYETVCAGEAPFLVYPGQTVLSRMQILSLAMSNQVEDVQRIYDGRAEVYDDSWHPRFTKHIIQLLKLKPGEDVLDLACGTGLVTYQASEAVGPSGTVVGVDVSSGMLAQAQKKSSKHPTDNVSFYQHSITDLHALDALARKRFDAISCISALVLLPEPEVAIKQWYSYLKPGGRLIVDVTHIRTLLPGIVLERVGRRMNRDTPSHRLLFQNAQDLRGCMVQAGLTDVKISFVSQLGSRDGSDELSAFIRDLDDPRRSKTYTIDEADDIFDAWIDGPFAQSIANSAVRSKAKELFREEWVKLGDPTGKIEEIDGVYVGIGWKTQ